MANEVLTALQKRAITPPGLQFGGGDNPSAALSGVNRALAIMQNQRALGDITQAQEAQSRLNTMATLAKQRFDLASANPGMIPQVIGDLIGADPGLSGNLQRAAEVNAEVAPAVATQQAAANIFGAGGNPAEAIGTPVNPFQLKEVIAALSKSEPTNQIQTFTTTPGVNARGEPVAVPGRETIKGPQETRQQLLEQLRSSQAAQSSGLRGGAGSDRVKQSAVAARINQLKQSGVNVQLPRDEVGKEVRQVVEVGGKRGLVVIVTGADGRSGSVVILQDGSFAKVPE
jgi:hypothetical protein